MKPVHLAASALAVGLIAAPAALAGPTPSWTSQNVFSAGPSNPFDNALGASSGSATIWSARGRLQARTTKSNTALGTTRTIQNTSASNLDVDIIGSTTYATWSTNSGRTWWESKAALGKRWATPKKTTVPAGGGAQIAENAKGQAVSAWVGTRTRPGGSSSSVGLWVSYRATKNGKWSTPRRLRTGVVGAIPLIDGNGRASVATTVRSSSRSSSGRIMVFGRRSNTSWPGQIVSGAFSLPVSAAINSRGAIAITYLVCSTPSDPESCFDGQTLYGVFRPTPTGAFGPASVIATEFDAADVAVDGQGRATVVWAEGETVSATESSDGTTWTETDISPIATPSPVSRIAFLSVDANNPSDLAVGLTTDNADFSQSAVGIARDGTGSWGDPTVFRTAVTIAPARVALNNARRAAISYWLPQANGGLQLTRATIS